MNRSAQKSVLELSFAFCVYLKVKFNDKGEICGFHGTFFQDSQKRRISKRSTSISSTAQPRGEEHEEHDLSVPSPDLQESKASPTKSQLEFASRTLLSSHTSSASEKPRNSPRDAEEFLSKLLCERERAKAEERKSLPGSGADSSEKSLKVSVPHRHSGAGREKKERSLRKTESRLSGHR